MTPSDESDDADGFVPPLPVEDRLWRHPSEMASSASSDGSGAPPTLPGGATSVHPGRQSRPRFVVVSAVAVAGVVVVLGVLAAVGTYRSEDRVGVEQVVVDAPSDNRALEALGPALARLDTTRVGETVATTAVVYRSDGYLLAAADSVAAAVQLTVTLADGRVLPATLVGSDSISGVAVVKVEASGLTTAALGGDEAVQPGDDAVAISHAPDPAGTPVVAAAQVTSTGWRLDGADSTRHDLIRAALGSPPASNGGALLCSPTGTVLGVLLPDQAGTARPLPTSAASTDATSSTVLATGATGGNTAHFATPIALAVRVADELVATGRAHYAWLGVQGDDLDTARAAALGRSGAVLTGVEEGGPADQGGLRTGDLIMAIDEQPIRSISELVIALRDRRPGDEVALSYNRGDDARRAVVRLSDSPE